MQSSNIPVDSEAVFPDGLYVTAEVTALRDFDRSTPDSAVQTTDKTSGLPVWSVPVHDGDPHAGKNAAIVVKVSAAVQPVPPEAIPGTPFRPVVFDNLTVTPYVIEANGRGRPRVGYSLRASGMHAPGKGTLGGVEGERVREQWFVDRLVG